MSLNLTGFNLFIEKTVPVFFVGSEAALLHVQDASGIQTNTLYKDKTHIHLSK